MLTKKSNSTRVAKAHMKRRSRWTTTTVAIIQAPALCTWFGVLVDIAGFVDVVWVCGRRLTASMFAVQGRSPRFYAGNGGSGDGEREAE